MTWTPQVRRPNLAEATGLQGLHANRGVCQGGEHPQSCNEHLHTIRTTLEHRSPASPLGALPADGATVTLWSPTARRSQQGPLDAFLSYMLGLVYRDQVGSTPLCPPPHAAT